MNQADQKQPTSSDSAYLERLEFDPALRKSWLNFFVTRTRVVILIIASLSIWGIWSYIALPRESNPEVKIPVAIIATGFPGAAPADVEELVTKKIETKASGLSGIKKITSSSANSISLISVEFEASEPLEEAIRNLRDKVAETQPDLPENADTSSVTEVSFDDQPIITFALSGPIDGFSLRSLADDAKDELEKIPGVREVRVSGGDIRELSISYDPNKLSALHIDPGAANRAIAATNVAIPGGTFEGDAFSYPVRTDSRFFTAETLGNIPVKTTEDGGVVFLKDIATVEERPQKTTILSRLSIEGTAPENSVTLDVVKRTGGSIIDTVDEANATMERLSQDFPEGTNWTVTVDFAKEIRKNFDELGRDFLITVSLVMGTLFLIVGLKEAIIAGLSVPLVFFVTFGMMLATGTSLNFLSLFSLLLSLGLLVDDAIVVVSATKQYLRTGKFTPEEAVLLVLRDFKVVLTTTTLTTIWAFLPLLLASGIIGQFIRSIPITVSVMLSASLAIALMVNHPLAAALERVRLTKNWFILFFILIVTIGIGLVFLGGIVGLVGAVIAIIIAIRMTLWFFSQIGKQTLRENAALVSAERKSDELIKKKLLEAGNREDISWKDRFIHGVIHFDSIIPVYERILRAILKTSKRRWTLLIGTGALFVGAVLLPVTGIVRSEFFPPSDEELIFINIEAPTGQTLDKTNAIVQEVEHRLLSYPEILNFSTVVGNSGLSQDATSISGGTSSNLAGIVIKLSDPKDRNIPSYTLASNMRENFVDIQGADIRVSSLQGGPPSGSAFEARIAGDDLETLDKIASDLKQTLAEVPGTTNIKTSLKNAPADYTFALDPVRLSFYGLDATSVGSTLRMAINGSKITTVLRENKEIETIARFDEDKIPSLNDVGNIEITTPNGNRIPLRNVADIRLEPSVASITRIDQKRTVLLSADASGTMSSTEILAQFQEKLKAKAPLPIGYTLSYGGENEENQESVASILRALVLAIGLIIATLIIQFNSLRQTIIVLATLPLAITGVFLGMALFDVSLSFPGLIGILALMGIVVKNAIILVDKMNLNWANGLGFIEGVVDAGKARIEAIFITSLSTILGLVPITLSNALWQALGTAIIFGLAVSSFFTILIIPTLSAMLMQKKFEEETA